MRANFWNEIARNKRGTVFLVILMAAMLVATGSFAAYYFEPEFWWVGGAGALIVNLIAIAWLPRGGTKAILRIADARDATPSENRILLNVAHEMSIAAGVPMPSVHVIDDPSLNAFATGWDPQASSVCFTSGMLATLDREELVGVMAHEVAHIRNYDTRLMMTLSLTVGIISMISDLMVRVMFRGRRGSRDKGGGAIMLIGLVFFVIAPIATALLNLAVSRRREYLADATAAQLTRYPDGLADALQKIADRGAGLEDANHATAPLFIASPYAKNVSSQKVSIFSTHPPIFDRIRKLRSMGFAGHERGEDGKVEMPPMPEIPLRESRP